MVDEEKYILRMAEAIKYVPYVDHGEPPSCEDMARAAFEEVYGDLKRDILEEDRSERSYG